MSFKNYFQQGLTYVIPRHHFVIRQKTQTYNISCKVGHAITDLVQIDKQSSDYL